MVLIERINYIQLILIKFSVLTLNIDMEWEVCEMHR